jgi:dTDP-4-dehydrorhamnose reductase
MKYFITGGSGLLGRRLATVAKDNDEITLVHNSNPSENTVKCDITNEEEVNTILNNENPDVIIHCAAMTNVDLCEDKKELAYKINGDGTGILSKAAKKIDAKIIYVSTDFVFD